MTGQKRSALIVAEQEREIPLGVGILAVTAAPALPDVWAALPCSVVQALDVGEPVSVGGVLVGANGTLAVPTISSETPATGPRAVQRWLDLFDRATWLINEADIYDARAVGRAFDSLFLYEHQLTPATRRQARETLWRRDRPEEPLPELPPHAPNEAPAGCHCPLCRVEWEHCRCASCRVARLRHRPASPALSSL